jgi:tRNA modification GTPase
MIHPSADTIVAIATPAGIGAIGVIRLSGPAAIHLADQVFSSKKKLADAPGYSIVFGKFNDGAQVLDEVLASVFKNPHSYTGEDSIEFSFHGSPYILQRALEICIEKGARLAQPGEFTRRAFLHGKLDLSQAEAVADLIAAENKTSHQIALNQMKGGFSTEIKILREKLIEFAALIELELDFGEEDVEFANRADLQATVQKINTVIQELRTSFKLGNVIKNGIQTVIAGRPNAGKSTLLNALLKEERAIVSPIPGTTRDTIEEVLHINGVAFRLIDTAGIREATDTIEAIGVQKTLDEIKKSSLLVYVYDATTITQADVKADLDKLTHTNLQLVVVANKKDEVENMYANLRKFVEDAIPPEHIYISAKNPAHIHQLTQQLYNLGIGNELQGQQIIVANARHYEALLHAGKSLDQVLQGLATGIPGDLLAMDIRQSLHALGTITGEVDVEDLLDYIFSKFCIGK